MTTPKSRTATAKPYYELLRDSRWQRKRLEIMERDGFACTKCGAGEDDGTTLNVHHAYYIKGHKPWEYDSDMLFTFCEDCHKDVHAHNNRLLFMSASMSDKHLHAIEYMHAYGDMLDYMADEKVPMPMTAILAAFELAKQCVAIGLSDGKRIGRGEGYE